MSRKLWLLSAVVLLLVLANLLQWVSRDGKIDVMTAAENARFIPSDFRIYTVGGVHTDMTPIRRNLFRYNSGSPGTVESDAAEAASLSRQPQGTDGGMPVAMSQLKVGGVIFRNGRGFAFVEYADASLTVRVGDKVAGRYIVKEIKNDTVVFEDSDTHVYGTISVSGK